MIRSTSGDMFEIEADARVNTVNCKGVMGAGVALAFKQRYPRMFKDYRDKCARGEIRPGKIDVWKTSSEWVINFPTKRHWRERSRYEDIEAGLSDLREYLAVQGPVTVTVPALGCGHGGLEWERVKPMIERYLGDLAHATIYLFEPASSHEVGRSQQRRALENLHFEEVDLPKALRETGRSRPHDRSEVFPTRVSFKGDPNVLASSWIAVLPSKSPSAREVAALESIAIELARRPEPVPLAFVYFTRATEAIAKLMVANGVPILMIVPFGPLSRPNLTLYATDALDSSSAIVSVAKPDAAWSPQALAQSLALLRAGCAGVLVTDPEPQWLSGQDAQAWSRLPIFYLRYDGLTDSAQRTFHELHARPLGRRANTGVPNLDTLLEPLGNGLEGHGSNSAVADAGGALDHQLLLFSSAADSVVGR